MQTFNYKTQPRKEDMYSTIADYRGRTDSNDYSSLEDDCNSKADEKQQQNSEEKETESLITPLERLFQHSVSENAQERQMVGKLMINIFRGAVTSNLIINAEEIFQRIEHIIYDNENSVRSEFVECLPHLASIIKENRSCFLGEDLSGRILNIILLYLRDRDNQVRQDAQAALRLLLDRRLFTKQQIAQDVCNVIVELSCEPVSELQALALTLMTKINPYIGDELTEKLFLDRFLELCKTDAVFVRRVCASIMGEFCTIMSTETEANYNKLLQVYANLCLDDNWGVRKTSVDVMMSVARSVPRTLRRSLLSKILVYHLQDESRWVRRSAYEILGPFISTFAKEFDEIICDNNGELMLVHGGEVPRVHALPVAKYSDIQSSITDTSYSIKNRTKYRFSYSKSIDESQFENKVNSRVEKNSDDSENFNSFRYYYDPPDIPLDQEFLNLISTNGNENKNIEDDTSNNIQISTKEESQDNLAESDNCRTQDSEAQNRLCNSSDLEVSLEMSASNIAANSTSNDQNNQQYGDEENSGNSNSECIDVLNETMDVSNLSDAEIRGPSRSSLSILNASNESEEEAKEIVPRILVEHFIAMADIHSSSNDVGPDMDYHCAYSFPAVVLTLGKENWYRLKHVYQTLAVAVPWKVRSTLASSIHEIAVIIEEEYTATDLVPIFNGFIKDLEEVRIGALKHFSTFLEVLTPPDRLQYLPKLRDFLITDGKSNWRLKKEFVKQLSEIIPLYDKSDAVSAISPLLLSLMQDKVAAVRLKALNALSFLIEHLEDDTNLVLKVVADIKATLLPHASERWVIRQMYAFICSELSTIISEEDFQREFLPYLLELAQDRVPNVRLVVARTLVRHVEPYMKSLHGTEAMNQVIEKIKIMQADSDRDVRLLASETVGAVERLERFDKSKGHYKNKLSQSDRFI